MQRGILIAIEGIDGSGKATQFRLLGDRLADLGYQIAAFEFPQYDKPSGYFVSQYFRGTYGSVYDVDPFVASLFYVLDHYAAATEMRKALSDGKIVVVSRYIGSSLAHQGTKISAAQERGRFYAWLEDLAFATLGLPKPTLTLILQVPASVCAERIVARDGLRPDELVMAKAAAIYDELAGLYPEMYQTIDGVRSGRSLGPGTVHQLIWGKVEPLLPVQTTVADHVPLVEAPNPAKAARLSILAAIKLLARRSGSTTTVDFSFMKPGFYTPKVLKGQIRKDYAQAMKQLLATHRHVVVRLTRYLARADPTLDASQRDLQASQTAQQLLPLATITAGQVMGSTALMSEEAVIRSHAMDEKIEAIARAALPTDHSYQSNTVTLTSFWPRSELDLVPSILYELSDQPLEQIKQLVKKWPRAKKVECLRAYLGAHAGPPSPNLLDDVQYTWDLVTDVATLYSWASHANSIAMQPISPRLGYDIPELIEQAGLSDLFEGSFDLSLQLYSQLQAAGHATEAQYACLLGHRLRWQMESTLAQLAASARITPDLSAKLRETTAEKHPLLDKSLE